VNEFNANKADANVEVLGSLDDFLNSKKEKTHPSEARIAEIFVERHGSEFRYVAQWGTWIKWDSTRWQEEKTLMVNDHIKAICTELSSGTGRNSEVRSLLKYNTISGAEKIARADRRVAATIEQWDRDPYLLNTPDGTVDLRTGSMREHRQSDYMTKMTSVAPNANCATPTWDAHLNKVFAGDTALASYIHRVGGYSLTGDVSEDALFFCYGEGGNGKTTTVELLRAIWGDYAEKAPMEMFMAKKHGHGHPTELTILHGARLVTASENERGSRFSEARVTELTGGGKIKARKMRRDFYTFEPTHKLMFEGNHRPRLSTVGYAWKRRVNMIPFTVKITKEDEDKDIDQKLLLEAPGILAKMIAGCLEWQQTRLCPPPSVVAATDAYMNEQDVLKEWFDECVQVESGAEGAFTTLLYESYHQFVKMRGEIPMGQTTFAGELENRASDLGIKKETNSFYLGTGETRKRGRGYRGIKSVKIPSRWM
jgi:putative DNA primase/helicase